VDSPRFEFSDHAQSGMPESHKNYDGLAGGDHRSTDRVHVFRSLSRLRDAVRTGGPVLLKRYRFVFRSNDSQMETFQVGLDGVIHEMISGDSGEQLSRKSSCWGPLGHLAQQLLQPALPCHVRGRSTWPAKPRIENVSVSRCCVPGSRGSTVNSRRPCGS
jgi:hypothetical protein